MKHVSRKWYEKSTSFLVTQGYEQSTSGHSLFILHKGTSFISLLAYVDDVTLVGNSYEEIERIRYALDDEFKIKDLGKLKYFLDIRVAHSKVGISIYQRKYYFDHLNNT
ncbi:hypothetical protein KIW84_046318 [Lathyrus oleraceus]|uniref:Reverse transcriptase Ty1/copia-type domain-containing protein n=1 Tax=Pisum sativum TaxID=3888 RepID=A0A9D5AYI4_PEA|nr:hypothetical protein KIW84_046318 [Pisum sativum]